MRINYSAKHLYLINPENLSDEELVKLSIEDADNFYYLMKRYENKLIRYIRRISNVCGQTAEDVLQDVFIKTYKNLNDFDSDLSFSSWIYQITHNTTISYVRKMKGRPSSISLDDDESMNFLNILKSDMNVKTDYIKNELSWNVRNVLELLDEKYRVVLILRFLEDKEYSEISDILKKPIGTVSILISRAKKSFKELAIKHNLDTYL